MNIFFFLIVCICAKIDIKHGELVENKGFLHLWRLQTLGYHNRSTTTKNIIASHKLYIEYQYFFRIRMCSISISQVLEVVRNGKKAYFIQIYQT